MPLVKFHRPWGAYFDGDVVELSPEEIKATRGAAVLEPSGDEVPTEVVETITTTKEPTEHVGNVSTSELPHQAG